MILPILLVIAIQSVANPIPYRDDMPAAEIHIPDEQQQAPPAPVEPGKQAEPEQDEPDEDSEAPSSQLVAQNNIDSTPVTEVVPKPPFRERHPRWMLFFKVIDKAISVGSGLAQLWYGTHK